MAFTVLMLRRRYSAQWLRVGNGNKDMRKNIDIVWEGIIRFIPTLRKAPAHGFVPATKGGNVVWVRSQNFSQPNHLRRMQGATALDQK